MPRSVPMDFRFRIFSIYSLSPSRKCSHPLRQLICFVSCLDLLKILLFPFFNLFLLLPCSKLARKKSFIFPKAYSIFNHLLLYLAVQYSDSLIINLPIPFFLFLLLVAHLIPTRFINFVIKKMSSVFFVAIFDFLRTL